MDQIWLAFSLLSLVTGGALFTAFLLLRRFAPAVTIPVAVIIGAFLFVGLSSLVGVYLRILEIPREIIGYRLLNTAAWGYVMWAAPFYLLHVYKFQSKLLRWVISLPAGLGVFIVLFFFGPFSGKNGGLLMLAMQVIVVFLTAWMGITSLKASRSTGSKPWRSLLLGVAVILFILPTAQLLDYGVTRAVTRYGNTILQDGFIFAVGCSIANIILIVSLVTGITKSSSSRYGTTLSSGFVAVYGLSRRETEIVEKVVNGKRDRDIAEELYISPRTVDTHLRNIFRKCGVASRMELFKAVQRYG